MARLLIGNVKGPQGDQGEQGVQGVPGNAATVNVGSTTTSAYGTQARVTNSGTSSNAILDFVIPQGAPGEETTEVGELTVDAITESLAEYPTYTVGEKMKVVLGKQLKYLNDLKTLTASQAQTITALNNKLNDIVADGAGAHNSIYRGKNLGISVTSAQWAAINAGTFEDLYVGDYWTINGIKWIITAFDYYWDTGQTSDTKCKTHHVVLIPHRSLYQAKMNNVDTTSDGYVGSKMYTDNLADAISIIETAFGASHILSHGIPLCNAVTSGSPSGFIWQTRKADIMTERNVFGCAIYGATNNGSNIPDMYSVDIKQFPLFTLNKEILNDQYFYLRDIVNAQAFCYYGAGIAYYRNASNEAGVIPSFCIKAAS